MQSLSHKELESGAVSLMRNCGFARGGAGILLGVNEPATPKQSAIYRKETSQIKERR